MESCKALFCTGHFSQLEGSPGLVFATCSLLLPALPIPISFS